jgi:hypothetical protein
MLAPSGIDPCFLTGGSFQSVACREPSGAGWPRRYLLAHFAALEEVLEGGERLLERGLPIPLVGLVEVDVVGAEPQQATGQRTVFSRPGSWLQALDSHRWVPATRITLMSKSPLVWWRGSSAWAPPRGPQWRFTAGR